MKSVSSILQSFSSRQGVCSLVGFAVLTLATCSVQAQLDPDARQILHIGANASLTDPGPLGAYAFYYWNMPSFPTTNQILRLVIAPGYVNSELGFKGLLGPLNDVGVGAFGGLFAENYSEVDGGKFYKNQSFQGDDVGVNASLYHRFNPTQMIPLTGVLRETFDYDMYQKNNDTASFFSVPGNTPVATTRAGFRWGGKEPVLAPTLAMEVSGWYELAYAGNDGGYGYFDDRSQAQTTQRFFGRAFVNYTTLKYQHYIVASLQGGGSADADRLSCYRLGGMLPYTKEFPLTIPGYYYEELSARDYGLANVTYAIPFGPDRRFYVIGQGAAALVNYVDGTGQSGAFNSGIGGGLGYAAPSKRWKCYGLFGYGFEAQRESGRGGYSLGIAFDYNFGSTKLASDEAYDQLRDYEENSAGTVK
jgi:hypothetical protein